MKRILSILDKEGFKCLHCERINLDFSEYAEYRDSDEHPAECIFERPTPPVSVTKSKVFQINTNISTILRYFLDGSRRTYKIADVIFNGRYLPLIAGQIGVAVLKRVGEGHGFRPMREFCRFENVIAFPELYNEDDLINVQYQINKHCTQQFKTLRYKVKSERDPVDLGVARIMKHMQDLEVEVVVELSRRNYLQNDSMLVIDGPLRFKEMKGRSFDIVQFRNVLGLSKTFRPSFTVGKGRKRQDVGSITSRLDFGERSLVYKTTEGEKNIGMWYLRVRSPHVMYNPLQGIVKIESFAIDPEDQEDGLDAGRVDTISSHILRERNVTPYGNDSRWASHIYPIYLAECFLKASFMSDVRFKALF